MDTRREMMGASSMLFGSIDVNNYLTMTALEDGFQASLFRELEYCIDGDDDWKTISGEQFTEPINAGQTISFRGNLSPASDGSGIGTFSTNKKFNLSGDCMSLLYGDDVKNNDSVPDYAFRRLFYTNTGVTEITSDNFLHAMALGQYCYYEMFDSSSITSVPLNLLPATTLAQECYGLMFGYCKRLINAPQLPAQNLATFCYDSMFRACNELVTAPELPATTLAQNCYDSMFRDCKNLTIAPGLPATTLKRSCYEYMFNRCTNLTTAPELPATTLERDCYMGMFQNCSKLNYIKMLATDISASGCLYCWVVGVASSGTFVKNPAMTSLPTASYSNDYGGIPSGWTVVNDGE